MTKPQTKHTCYAYVHVRCIYTFTYKVDTKVNGACEEGLQYTGIIFLAWYGMVLCNTSDPLTAQCPLHCLLFSRPFIKKIFQPQSLM